MAACTHTIDARSRQKQSTHERIIRSAARLLRRSGISKASVAEVMRDAGLTVGGFYAHFASKDALVDAVLRQSMSQMRGTLMTGLEDRPPDERIEKVLQRYLSRTHRDHPDAGCPLPAVLGEIAHEGESHRNALSEGIEEHVEAMVGRSARSVGLATLALMIGGLTLARALQGTPLSDEVLKACRDYGRAALSGSGIQVHGRRTR